MKAIKTWRKIAFALLSLLLLAALSVALIQFLPAQAEDSVTVTIHADASGTVEYVVDGNAEEPETYGNTVDVGNQSETISISTDQYLHLKATISEEAAVDHLFQYWTAEVTDHDVTKAVSSAVSLKSEDTFGFQELQTLATNDLYANFVAKITNTKVPEMVDKAKLQFDYNADLGDVYFFMGNPNVEEHFIIAHGIKLDPKQPYSLPLDNKSNAIAGAAVRAYYPNFLAVPKTDIQSSMDSKQHTTAKFGGWTAAYYNYDNQFGTILAQSTGVIPGYKNGTTVEEFWKAWRAGGTEYAQVTHMKNANPANLVIYPSQNTEWNYNDTNKPLYFDPMSMGVIFQEVPLIPNISADKQEGDKPVENIEKIENGQQITFDFGNKNTLTLHIEKIGSLTKEDLSIMIDGVEYNNQIEDIGGPDFIFPYQLHGRATVTISYANKEDEKIAYSDFGVTFYLEETSEGTIADIIKTPVGTNGTLTITNDNDNKWIFDPVLSEVDNYAYGLKVETEWRNGTYWGVKTLSNLTFALSGAETGSVSFEFQLKGYYQEASLLTKNLKVGQLWYGDQLFTNSDNLKVGVEKKQTNSDEHYWDEEIVGATWLGRPKAVKDGGMEFANSAVALGDGWYRVSIPIKQGSPVYLGFLVCGWDDYTNMGTPYYKAATVSIRNVQLATGNKDVTLKLGADAGNSTATATIGDSDVHNASTDGDKFTVSAGATVKLTANPQDGNDFYGWSVNGQLVSTETEANVFVNDDSEIIAWIAPKDCYVARADGTFYKTVEEAGEGASRGQTIYLLNEKATVNRSFTIKEGVTFLLPYDETNKLTAMGSASTAANQIAWLGTTYNVAYRTLTVTNSAIITVKGTLAVGGVVGYPGSTEYMGCTSGHYSEIILEKGSKIQVASGGVMDVYGRIWGGKGKTGTEMGTIDVAKGGKLYEPFLILDYAGGSNAAGMFLSDNPTTPFKRYAMINIEVPMTINYGGALIGHANLYALSQFFSLDQTFIGDDSAIKSGGTETFVMLSEGSKVTITYDPEKVVGDPTTADCTEGIGLIKMVFEGGATFSYMLFSAMGISVPTNSVYFSIPYNYEVELNDFANPQNSKHAQYETKTDFMIMPGAVVKVGKGATLTLNANAWVYDGLVQGNLPSTSKAAYPTADRLASGGYSKNGNLIVNGTLKIGIKTTVQKFEIFDPGEFTPETKGATFLGIIQTEGGGHIDATATDGYNPVLEGKIFDGINGKNYFAYTTTARVWDKAHNCFGDLEAGHTYTATSGAEFKLAELKYTTTEGGAEDQTLKDLNQTLYGSWKVDHSEDAFDWTPNEKDSKPDDSNRVVELTRQCTELGCDHTENKLLLKSDGLALSATYKGKNFTEDDIIGLIKAYYNIADKYDYLKITVDTGSGTIHNAATYPVTVALENGYFVDISGSSSSSSKAIQFTVNKFDVEKLDQDAIKAELQDFVYDGTEHTNDNIKLRADGLSGEVSHMAFVWDNNTAAGEDTASVTIKGSGTNFEGTLTVYFSIAKADLTVTINEAESTYGEDIAALSVTLDGRYVAVEATAIQNAFTLSTTATQWGGAGKYPINAEYSADDDVLKNYEVTVTNSGSNLYTVTAKDIKDAVLSVKTAYTYDRQAKTPGIGDITGTLAGYEDFADALAEFTVGDYQNNTAAGVNSASVKVTASGNYTGSQDVKFSIQKAVIDSVVVTNDNLVYNGAKQTPELTVKAGGLEVNPGEYNATYDDEGFTAAGVYNITIKSNSDNFTTSGEVKTTFTISPKGITVTVNKQDWAVYTGYEITVSSDEQYWTVEDGALEGSDNKASLNVVLTGEAAEAADIRAISGAEGSLTDAGSYNIRASYTNGNYTVTFAAGGDLTTSGDGVIKGAFVINPKDIGNATFKVVTPYTYDRKEHRPAAATDITGTLAEYEDFAEDLKKFTVDGYQKNIDAGSEAQFTITANGNYTGHKFVTFTIQKAVIDEVTVNGNYTYNGEKQEISLTVTAGKLTLNSGEYTANYDKEELKAAGEYTVTVTTTHKNFMTTTGVKATFNIGKKAIDVTVNKQTVDYNGAEQSVSSTENDWTVAEGALAKNDEKSSLNVALSGSYKDAGSYDITASYKNDNYDVTFKGADGLAVQENTIQQAFVINKLELKVTISGATSVYGEAVQGLSYGLSGHVEGEKSQIREAITLASEAEQWSSAGKYPITAQYSADDDVLKNYNVTVTNKENNLHTVSPKNIEGAKLTVAGTYTYNGQEQQPGIKNITGTLEGGYDNNGFGEALKGFTVGYSGNTAAGMATVTLTAESGNYTGTATGSFEIGKAALTVTVNTATSTYGEEIATLSVTLDGNYVEGETENIKKAFELTPTATQWSDVNSYPVTAKYTENEGVLKNYEVTVTNSGENLYTVTAKDIKDAVLTVGGTYTYNRQAHKPTANDMTGTLAGYEGFATALKNFTVGDGDYADNTEAGTATVTVHGTGNYTGTATGSFVIGKAVIDKVEVTNNNLTYTGAKQTPTLKVTAGGLEVNAGEYNATYDDEGFTDADDYKVTITTTHKNFEVKAEVTTTFTIKPKDIAEAELSVKTSYTYDGTEKQPAAKDFNAAFDGYDGFAEAFANFVFGEYQNNTAAGTNSASVKVTANGNYTGSKEVNFSISPATVTFELVKNEYVYTGKQIQPEVKVTWKGGDVLESGKYELSYGDNTNVSDQDISVSITLKDGNFTIAAESKKLTFNITARDITGATVTITTGADAIIYKNEQWQPAFTVSVSGIDGNLNGNTDYTVEYGTNINVKEGGSITVRGTGNYTGTASTNFDIKPRQVTVTPDAKNSPEGQALVALTFRVDGYIDSDLETFKRNIEVSVASGAESGTAGQTFDITAKFIDGVTAENYPNYTITFETAKYTITAAVFEGVSFNDATVTYNREAHTIEVQLPEEKKAEGEFGKVEYTYTAQAGSELTENKAIDAGKYDVKAVITFTAADQRSYTLTLTAVLTIDPAEIDSVVVNNNNVIYNGKQQTPALTVKAGGLEVNVGEYSVSYDDNGLTNARTYNVTVTAANKNFKTTEKAKTTFTIKPMDIKDAKVEIQTPDGGFVYKAAKWEPQVTSVKLTVGDGEKTLIVTSDYNVTYGGNTNVSDDNKVIVSGKGNYTGTAEKTFEITPAPVTFNLEKQSYGYTGEKIEPNVTAKWGGNNALDKDGNFTVACGENLNVDGTNNVTVTIDNENFAVDGGTTKTLTFKITAKDITVTVNGQTVTYNGSEQSASSTESDWTVEDGALVGKDKGHKDVLNVVLSAKGTDADSYDITASYTNSNYNVTFEGEESAFVINPKAIDVTVKTQTVTYSGGAQGASSTESCWTVEDGALAGKDVGRKDALNVVLSAGGTDAGSYDITASYTNGNYTVTFKGEEGISVEENKTLKNAFVISPKDIAEAELSVKTAYTYDRQAKTPAADDFTATLKGYDGFAAALKGFEFGDYRNNTDAGTDTASVKVTASGNYTGSKVVKFSITPATVKFELVKQSYEYTGKQIQPTVKVTWNGGTVLESDKYELSYGANINVADKDISVSITLTDGKNYTIAEQSKKLTFKINPKDIAEAELSVKTAYTYDRQAKTPKADDFTATLKDYDGFAAALKGFEFGDYKNNTDACANTASVKVTANGNYTGSKVVNFSIQKAKISGVEVTGSYTYSGKKQTPALKVMADKLEVNAGEYNVSYDKEGLTDAGVYKVTITTTHKNFEVDGEVSATFTILQKDIGEAVLSVTAEYTYDGQAKTPAIGEIGGTLAGYEGFATALKNFTVGDYQNNTAAGTNTASVKVTANGNYTGSKVVNFSIQKADLTVTIDSAESTYGEKVAALSVTLGGSYVEGEAEEIKAAFELSTTAQQWSDVNGYPITAKYTENEGVLKNYKVNLTNAQNTAYTVNAKDIAGAVLSVTAEYTYDGQAKTPAIGEIGGTLAGYEGFATALKNFTVGDYQNNTAAGTNSASVKVTANGNYTGSKVVNFSIQKADLTVTIDTAESTYGEKVAALSVTLGGSYVEGEAEDIKKAFTLSTTAQQWSDVNSYPITAQYSADAGVLKNYKVNLTNAENTAYTVNPKSIEGAVVEVTGKYTYTGSPIVPKESEVSVTLAGYTPTYDISASGNTNATKGGALATVTLSGNGNFTGKAAGSFAIAPKQIEVTLHDQTFDYSGEVPALDQSAYTPADGAVYGEDALGVEITAPEAKKDQGSYALQATASNENYTVKFSKAQLIINKLAITVKADGKEAYYGDSQQPLTYTATGLVKNEQPEDVLQVSLHLDRTLGEAGDYTISGTGSAQNYSFTVESATYKVKPKEITITITSVTAPYTGKEPVIDQRGWTAQDGAIINSDNLFVELTKEEGVDVKDGGYKITGKYNNKNYKVTFVEGTYTFTALPIAVRIGDQSAVYDYQAANDHSYVLNGGQWQVDQDAQFAEGEGAEDLGVTLSLDREPGDAGLYAIKGDWTNKNYAVTFAGSYQNEDDPLNGVAGAYTINKQDVSGSAIFMLTVEGGVSEGSRVIRAKFEGKNIPLTGVATVFEGEEPKELVVKVDDEHAELTAVGEYSVTLTIEDKNYSGSTVFKVIITDAEGYTARLREVLAQLAELAEGIDSSDFGEEDYAKLVQINSALNSLDEKENEVGREELAQYKALVEAWNALADTDSVIATAEIIADAPIKSLFGAAAALTALAALAYIALKGGLL